MSSEASARIRENQRRSRARKKEYIHDLERRLRKFEQHGVEATVEVQAAAKHVAEENARLRSLLRLRGVRDAEIDEYLHASDQKIVSPIYNQHAALESQIMHPASNFPTVSNGNQNDLETMPEGRSREPLSPETEQDEWNTPSTARQDYPNEQSYRHVTRYSNTLDNLSHYASQEIIRLSTLGPERDSELRRMRDDKTSCEEAASIIASMRGLEDPEAIRAELGCSPGLSCKVGNMAIFQAMDR